MEYLCLSIRKRVLIEYERKIKISLYIYGVTTKGNIFIKVMVYLFVAHKMIVLWVGGRFWCETIFVLLLLFVLLFK